MNSCAVPVINFHVPFFTFGSAKEDVGFAILDRVYFPLLKALEELENDDVDYSLVISLSPFFLECLANPQWIARYRERTRRLLDETDRSERRDTLRNILFWLDQYREKPLDGLLRLASYGHVEITTGTVSNALLPLLAPVKEAVNAQVAAALTCFTRRTGNRCHSLFLNHAHYYPGLDPILAENGVEYVICSPNVPSRESETPFPVMGGSSQVAVFQADSRLSDAFVNCLNCEWQKADEAANQFLGQLQAAGAAENGSDAVPVRVFFADALQLVNENKEKKANMKFLDLTLRKIRYDQDSVKTVKPAVYLENCRTYAEPGNLFTPNLAPYYQAGYQQLFPELHLAAMQLGKLRRGGISPEAANALARELLLAQSGDHRPAEDSFCREHLQKFTLLNQTLSTSPSATLPQDFAEEPAEKFLDGMDLSTFY